jgi:hypothetical protein
MVYISILPVKACHHGSHDTECTAQHNYNYSEWYQILTPEAKPTSITHNKMYQIFQYM